MTDALRPSGAVELAVLERSGLIESRHLGAAVVTGPDGIPILTHGDDEALVYPRSTLKLLQAVTLLDLGAPLAGPELVLAAASHPGTARHVEVVRRILDRAGLTDAALQCPAEWPSDADTRHAAEAPHRLTMNCSGKHAAFLLASVTQGWPIESYLEPRHPLQLSMRRTIEDFSGESVEHSGMDGCGAPVHALTLRGLAIAIGRVVGDTDPESAPARLTRAIRADPWALDLPAVATVMEETDLVVKRGAEGVLVAAAPDGTAVAIKMLDGSSRATLAVALRLFVEVGVIDADHADDLTRRSTEAVLGGGELVGELRSVV
jgi:L-asparaginase II